MAALQLPRHRLATLLQALGGSLWHAAESLAEDGMLLMGRRDKRTKKGKIFKGIGGKSRPRTQLHFPMPWWHLPEVDLRNPIPIAPGMHAWQQRRQSAAERDRRGRADQRYDSDAELEEGPEEAGEVAGGHTGSSAPEDGYTEEYEEGIEGDYDKQEDEENVGVEGSDYVHDEAIEEGVDDEEADMDAQPGEYAGEEDYGEGSAEGLELHSDEDVASLTDGELGGLGDDTEPRRLRDDPEALELRGGERADALTVDEQGGAAYSAEPQRLQHESKDREMRGSEQGEALSADVQRRSGYASNSRPAARTLHTGESRGFHTEVLLDKGDAARGRGLGQRARVSGLAGRDGEGGSVLWRWLR